MAGVAVMLGTGAATADSHPYSLQIDGLDVAKQPGTPGGLFGTEIDSIIVTEQLGGIDTIAFTIDDPGKVLSISKGANIYFADHRGRRDNSGTIRTDDVFRGIVRTAEVSLDGLGFIWHIVGDGLSVLLDQRVVVSLVLPLAMTTRDAIQSLMSTMDGRISALAEEASATPANVAGELIAPNGILVSAISLSGMTYRRALEQIIAVCSDAVFWPLTPGGLTTQGIVSIDVQGRTIWKTGGGTTYLPGDGGAFGTFHEGTGAPAQFPAMEDISYSEDATSLVNAVYVKGPGASGWITDAASIAAYGRREAFLTAPEAINANARDSIGTLYLSAHGVSTRLAFTLSGAHDEFFRSTNPGSYHVRMYGQPTSGSGLWPTLVGLALPLWELTKQWRGGAMMMSFVFLGTAQAGGRSIAARLATADENSRAAGRLAGTFSEVAVTTHDGAPTDADFDVPRDGYMVLDTTNNKWYARTGGVWKSVTLT